MLSLLPYHHQTAEYLKQQRSVWDFFASHNQREEQLKSFKTDLLKNTYKFDEATDAALYQKAKLASEKLQLSLPVYLYQAQHSDEMNASILYLDNEVHIVFSGRILELLNEDEKLAVIAHELSHVLLYTQLNGEAEVADRMITAIVNHSGGTPAHYETARLFKLYTEIYCDRGAYLVTSDYGPIISSLVKIATNLQTVNPDSYIKQAEEIFSLDSHTRAAGVSHPENFIRARAISLWHKLGIEAETPIQQMLEANSNFEELDLFKQLHVSLMTRQLISMVLQPAWMRTPATIALAKQYFGNLELDESFDKTKLSEQTDLLHNNLKEYLAYVLYDFTTADKTLEDDPLGLCFFIADELKMENAFLSAIKKEKKLTDKKATTLKKRMLTEFHDQNVTA